MIETIHKKMVDFLIHISSLLGSKHLQPYNGYSCMHVLVLPVILPECFVCVLVS